ncbi:UNVERIFIED_CONTAM: hypothetical protein K2H54_019513 [Gekko kuhli]
MRFAKFPVAEGGEGREDCHLQRCVSQNKPPSKRPSCLLVLCVESLRNPLPKPGARLKTLPICCPRCFPRGITMAMQSISSPNSFKEYWKNPPVEQGTPWGMGIFYCTTGS